MKYEKVIIFLLILFSISYYIEFELYPMISNNLKMYLLMGLMWVPTLTVIIVNKLFFNEKVFTKEYGFRINFSKWLVIGAIIPLILILLTILVSLQILGVSLGSYKDFLLNISNIEEVKEIPETVLLVSTLLNGLFIGLSLNAFFAFGEEFAWRGFLQKELEGIGFWKSSFFIGIIWGLWHAGLIYHGYNFPNHPKIGIVFMTIGCAFFGIILSFFRKKSGSVITPALAHGVFNAFAGLTIVFINIKPNLKLIGHTVNYHELVTGVFGLIGIGVYLLVCIFLIITDKKPESIEYEEDILTNEKYMDY